MSDRKSKIIVLQGLPGSGKSTKAREIVESNDYTLRVNKDDLRKMAWFLDKNRGKARFNRSREDAIVRAQQAAMKSMLEDGFDVVVDDTNLGDKYVNRYKQFARGNGYDFEVISLLDLPVEECCKRDAGRPESERVGRSVIYKLAATAGVLPPTKNKKVELTTPYIVVDIDGTVANCDHRLHYIRGVEGDPNFNPNFDKDWNKFFDCMIDDEPREEILDMIRTTYKDYPVVFVSGRPESYRVPTEEWLELYEIKYHALLMRPANVLLPDTVVKQEILEKYLDKNLIHMVIDDRASVIDMWRNNGLPVLNVGGPNNAF